MGLKSPDNQEKRCRGNNSTLTLKSRGLNLYQMHKILLGDHDGVLQA